ncbi:hypothetical protein HNY73_022058 [Argiope bruennichi]|uniref:Uncharacterized protein n=1 Tax=Argiope bruennichi TaxID=94029 RepID=A0A8T0E127_ARGBR|nr:hypothetical protein HNY73_022058 [Argiope bruennichi]
MQSNSHADSNTLNVPPCSGWREEYKFVILGRTIFACVGSANSWGRCRLSMAVISIEDTRVVVTLRFCLTTTAIYQSSIGVVTIGWPATGLLITVWVVSNFYQNRKMKELRMSRNRTTCCSASMNPADCPVSMRSIVRQCLESSIHLLEVVETSLV